MEQTAHAHFLVTSDIAGEGSSEAKCPSTRTSATSVGGVLVQGERVWRASFWTSEPLLADFHCAKGPRRFSWLLRWIFSGHVTWRRKIFSLDDLVTLSVTSSPFSHGSERSPGRPKLNSPWMARTGTPRLRSTAVCHSSVVANCFRCVGTRVFPGCYCWGLRVRFASEGGETRTGQTPPCLVLSILNFSLRY